MKKIIAQLAMDMIAYSQANLHDIEHFMKVWAYACLIGEKELADEADRAVLQAAALLHDIACPLCREKYGHTRGDLQEKEGMTLAERFLAPYSLEQSVRERLVWLVGHHHTIEDLGDMVHRVLLEADFLVNAGESGYSGEQIRSADRHLFHTKTGLALLHSIYPQTI